jgi:hypothetical protein
MAQKPKIEAVKDTDGRLQGYRLWIPNGFSLPPKLELMLEFTKGHPKYRGYIWLGSGFTQ